MTKEQMADQIIEKLKNKKFDNRKIYSEIKRKEAGKQHLSHAKFDNPADFDDNFLNGFRMEIVKKLAQIENDSEWVITVYFSIFGGKKPNDLHIICVYDDNNGFRMYYIIESDHSYLVD